MATRPFPARWVWGRLRAACFSLQHLGTAGSENKKAFDHLNLNLIWAFDFVSKSFSNEGVGHSESLVLFPDLQFVSWFAELIMVVST